MITCTNCHTQNPDGKKFCRECGSPLTAPAPSPHYQSQRSQEQSPTPQSQIQTTTKKKNKWWIWVILIIVLAVIAYVVFFGGGMGSPIKLNKGTGGGSIRTEKDLVEALVESLKSGDSFNFIDNHCLSRADLDELNSFLPEDEQFDPKEASGKVPRTIEKLERDWDEILKSSEEENWDWSNTKVVSVSFENMYDNPKVLSGIYAVIESGGRRYGLFLESCVKF